MGAIDMDLRERLIRVAASLPHDKRQALLSVLASRKIGPYIKIKNTIYKGGFGDSPFEISSTKRVRVTDDKERDLYILDVGDGKHLDVSDMKGMRPKTVRVPFKDLGYSEVERNFAKDVKAYSFLKAVAKKLIPMVADARDFVQDLLTEVNAHSVVRQMPNGDGRGYDENALRLALDETGYGVDAAIFLSYWILLAKNDRTAILDLEKAYEAS